MPKCTCSTSSIFPEISVVRTSLANDEPEEKSHQKGKTQQENGSSLRDF